MKFEEAISQLESYSTAKIIKNYELGTIVDFTRYLGIDTTKYFIIHITGTSGKGSTANYINEILYHHKLKVGLFTSPHVQSVRERIVYNGQMISETDFARFFDIVLKAISEFSKTKTADGLERRNLTYFEIVFAIALLFFQEKGIEVGIFEVGLGGKLDTTNILKGDIAVITNVGLDHTEILGDTVEKIAQDKVQIVKKGAICISGARQDSVKGIISRWCERLDIGAKILFLDKDFGASLLSGSIEGSIFSFYSRKYPGDGNKNKEKIQNGHDELWLKDLRISLPGKYQIDNAVCAIEASLSCLSSLGRALSSKSLRMGLQAAKLIGRFDIRSNNVKDGGIGTIIWDGAHNADKIEALVRTIDEVTNGDISILFAVKKGKNSVKMIEKLAGLKHRLKHVVITKYRLKQDVMLESESIKKLVDEFNLALDNGKNRDIIVEFAPDPIVAYENMKRELGKGEILLVTGSFYLLSVLSSKKD